MYSFVAILTVLAAVDANPLYHVLGYYIAPQYYQPPVFAPKPQVLHHRAHAAAVRISPPPTPVSPLISNSITYTADPDADPDDALEVAQFHSQDAAGRVIFGFNTPTQARMEARSVDGTVRGSYSYIDPYGKTVKMQYWDDGTGFHTSGVTAPGQFFENAPYYTAEVQAARDQHFQLYEQALLAAAESGQRSEESSGAYDTGKKGVLIEPVNHYSPESPTDGSSDSVSIDNPNYLSLQVGPVKNNGETAGSGSAQNDNFQGDSNLALVNNVEQEGNSYQYVVPVPDPLNGRSESLHAALYGAIPVDAVHDTQVSPSQKNILKNHQVLPLLVKTRASKSA